MLDHLYCTSESNAVEFFYGRAMQLEFAFFNQQSCASPLQPLRCLSPEQMDRVLNQNDFSVVRIVNHCDLLVDAGDAQKLPHDAVFPVLIGNGEEKGDRVYRRLFTWGLEDRKEKTMWTVDSAFELALVLAGSDYYLHSLSR